MPPTTTMSSKERIMAAINHETVDHVPLCFEGVGHHGVDFLARRYACPFERAEYLLDVGIDTALHFSLPNGGIQTYKSKQWTDQPQGEEHPVMHSEIETSRGTLSQVVRKIEHPRDEINLFSDFNIPAARSIKYLIENEEDLDKLEQLLQLPDKDQMDGFFAQMQKARSFCDEHQIPLSGYVCGVGDPLIWMSGVERLITMAFDNPHMLQRYIDIVAEWDMANVQILLDAGVDIVIRRGLYETLDFWSPALYRQYFFPSLKREIALVHQAGKHLTYVMLSGFMGLLDTFIELDFDLLSNIDPAAPGIDMVAVKRRIGQHIALLGGVNNYHVMEHGTTDQVRQAVSDALQLLGTGGGFILSPSDWVDYECHDPENAERNVNKMIATWKEIRNEE